jgi:hypothetical protein
MEDPNLQQYCSRPEKVKPKVSLDDGTSAIRGKTLPKSGQKCLFLLHIRSKTLFFDLWLYSPEELTDFL